MPLNKSALEAQIKMAFKEMKSSDGDEEATLDKLCGKLAEAIDTYVKTATIVYIGGMTTDPATFLVKPPFNGNLT
ncbi:hypothetical protein [Chitinophaga sancti]|uniref:Uncharacterized protein n=1 Tax=Chitinophaga sancti TaxID=1004 RepID=A0A1K1LPT2_9BACT|nr:hypothetical protein [Chitinophaga sancti]WQD64946.1 hypothetical protein U0033_11125 [Chitinophaga sancti]WQG89430.1 hypothetical protein SR876_31345 [Chitinophaga sancti]SFW12888.1 hypothetical protein SAMN05661012_00115 [Chitinophaga sancti]